MSSSNSSSVKAAAQSESGRVSEGTKLKEEPQGEAWSTHAALFGKFFAEFTNLFAKAAVDGLVAAFLQQKRPAGLGSRVRPVRVLDIAAGTGVGALCAIDALFAGDPGLFLSVTATDISAGMLSTLESGERLTKAKAAHGDQLVFDTKVADMCQLDFVESGTVDVAVIMFGIMFPDDPVAAMKEVKRILSPTGVATIVTWHYNFFIEMMKHAAVDSGKVKRVEDLVLSVEKFGQESVMRNLAEAAGFDRRTECSCTFVSRQSVPIPASVMVATMNTNPASAPYGPFDPERLSQLLARRCPGVTAPALREGGEKEGGDTVDREPATITEGTALCFNLGF
uniref:Methyltransferase type 11 domain-containing protein n=1 Tax=Chromera velia CCMP2878 TaxID=1169474 RepID=A0A0G4HLL4_9ALVE|eukprot:Cvel_7368.t1-p1 / transcript=Cvel_7368.t1 / gene=Cvel_7368 / organism=Chromera_velia_CCMP2878 / gene_product=hypothetical protein / transcript_product=hypothetical protein / location=Cvel_scaffold383:47776-48786(-) / protein_length=337 / sequence_SO=supercontig / SO=protein_coding / is_pseudo=false